MTYAVWESPGRVAFSLGGFEVMWYGICIAAGILAGFYFIYRRAPLYHDISSDRAFNLVILILIAALVGTRAYYVAFRWDFYSQNLGEILNIREGGLAIHGGLIFGIAMTFVLSRIWKESALNILDLFFVAIPLGQAIGRWGNFFNSEAHGGHTDLPWAILVDGDTVHPAFLYESIWCLFLFFLLMKIGNHRRFQGQVFFLYMILYSVERFFVEGLRTDNLIVHFPFGDFRQAQVLSLGAIAAGAILYVVFYRKQLRIEAAEIVEDSSFVGLTGESTESSSVLDLPVKPANDSDEGADEVQAEIETGQEEPPQEAEDLVKDE